MIGANPITSFSDGSAEANVATEVYEDLVQEELSLYPWSFSKDQATLNLLAAVPVAEWEYAFQLPPAVLSVLRVTVNDNNVPFERFGDKVFTNEAADVDCTYVYRASENNWAPYFASLVVHKLAALFATSIAERPKLAEALLNELNTVRLLARNRDASSQTTRRIQMSRFRRSRGSDSSDVYA